LSAVALERRRKITQHIPGPGEHLVRYYGWYSNKLRGLRRRQAAGVAAAPAVAVCEDSQATAAASASIAARRRRQRWAELIRRVYEVDPLRCPRCGGQMRIIAFLEPRDQAPAIARILRHCGLWTDPPPQPAPAAKAYPDAPQPEFLYVAEEGGVYHVPGV
jgi:hypothetical protein